MSLMLDVAFILRKVPHLKAHDKLAEHSTELLQLELDGTELEGRNLRLGRMTIPRDQ